MRGIRLLNAIAVILFSIFLVALGNCSLGTDIDTLWERVRDDNAVPVVAVTGLNLDRTSLSLYAGNSEDLTASVQPADATDRTVTWASDDSNIASVNASGRVTAVAPGTVNISATASGSGFSASCAVTVAAAHSSSLVDMIWVQGGSFDLGKELGAGNDETPVSRVTLSGFYIARHEVTQELYDTVMGYNPGYFASDPHPGENQDRRPIEQISWYNALVFCNRLSILEGLMPVYSISGSSDPADWGDVPSVSSLAWNAVAMIGGSSGYCLPTEAQWEYAAKGGRGAAGYTYSGSSNPDNAAWYNMNSFNMTHEVGTKSSNSLGICDMSGNVWEWCWDRHGAYTGYDKADPPGAASGDSRVMRGGSWGDPALALRSVNRSYNSPSGRSNLLGFRLVRR